MAFWDSWANAQRNTQAADEVVSVIRSRGIQVATLWIRAGYNDQPAEKLVIFTPQGERDHRQARRGVDVFDYYYSDHSAAPATAQDFARQLAGKLGLQLEVGPTVSDYDNRSFVGGYTLYDPRYYRPRASAPSRRGDL